MQQNDRYTQDSLVRSKHFIDTHAAELGLIIVTSASAQQLAAGIDGVQVQALEQDTAVLTTRGMVTREAALTVALRDVQMKSIATFARTAFAGSGSPAIAALTRSSRTLRGRKLVAGARAMASAAAAHVMELVGGGFPRDVVEQLTAAADALDRSIKERENLKTARIGAGKGIQVQLASGVEAVRKLDGSITRQLAGNPRLLAEWRQARRAIKKPGVASTSAASKEAAHEVAQSQAA